MLFLVTSHPLVWMWLPGKPKPALTFSVIANEAKIDVREETTLQPCDTAEQFGVCLVPYESQLLAGRTPYSIIVGVLLVLKPQHPHHSPAMVHNPFSSIPVTPGIPVLLLSRALCILEELEKATSYPRFDEPEPGFREIWPTWDGKTVGRENSSVLQTVHPGQPGHSYLPAHTV